MYHLIIEDSEGQKTVVPLTRNKISIGRKEGNMIRLTERNVSRHHAALRSEGGQILVQDLDSYNGIKINGNKISGSQPLKAGDLIEIGDYHLVLSLAHPDEGRDKIPTELPNTEKTIPRMQLTEAPTHPDMMDGWISNDESESLPSDDMPTAPSRPVSRIISEAPAPASQKIGSGARLVALNQGYAGQEFAILEPEVTFGRSEVNNFKLNHNSISWQHAKILIEAGQYRIIDLDSRNGIRINGTDCKESRLKSGDIAEMGQIKFRFVMPGESWSLAQEITSKKTPVQAAPEEKLEEAAILGWREKIRGKEIHLAIGLACLLAGAIGITMALNSNNQRTTIRARGLAAESRAALARQVARELKIPAKVHNASTAESSNTLPALTATSPLTMAQQLEKALQAMKNHDWSQASYLYRKILKADPANDKARLGLARARRESRNKRLYQAGYYQLRTKNYYQAYKLLSQITTGSLYASMSLQQRLNARHQGISYALSQARKALQQKRPKRVLTMARQALELDSESTRALSLIKRAQKLRTKMLAVALKPIRAPKRARTRTVRKVARKTPVPLKKPIAKTPVKIAKTVKEAVARKVESTPRAPQEPLAQILKRATKTLLRSPSRSISLFKSVLKRDMKNAKALRSLGIAYAALGKKKSAVYYYNRYLRFNAKAHDATEIKLLIRELKRPGSD